MPEREKHIAKKKRIPLDSRAKKQMPHVGSDARALKVILGEDSIMRYPQTNETLRACTPEQKYIRYNMVYYGIL